MLWILVFGISTASAGWTEGKHNSAIEFNGTTTYVDGFGAIGNIKSVSFWMKADDITSRKIMDFDGTDQIEIDGSGNILATSFPGTVAIYIDGVNKTASPTIDTDWHHIAITTDTNVNASAVVIGKVSASFFDGTLDDVKIYAYARSTDEILLDYNSGVATHLGPSGKTCSEDPAGCMDYGLVGSWGMDEGTGTTAYDSSDNSNNGTLTNGPTWTTDSSPLAGGGGSLKFDGVDDYVEIPNPGNILDNESLTIIAWVYHNRTGSDYQRIVDRVYGGQFSFYIATSDTTNYQAGEISWALSTTGGYLDYHDGDVIIPESEWVQAVLTYDGNNAKIYLNGVLKDTHGTTISGGLSSSTDAIRIGQRADIGNDRYFNGSIDSVRIYNRALSAEEVRYHYNKGGPVAEWKFDEGSGQTAFDESWNNNDGTLGATSGVEASDPTWVEGKYGGALSFDGGDDYVLVAHDGSLMFKSGNFSVGVWGNPANMSGYTGLISADDNSDSTWRIIRNDGDNHFRAKYSGTTLSYSDVLAGDWHYYVFTKNGTILTLYFDGEVVTSGACSATHNVDGTELVLGSYRISNAKAGVYIFNGLIDDVRIYNYARTAEQIQMDYNAGVATHFR